MKVLILAAVIALTGCATKSVELTPPKVAACQIVKPDVSIARSKIDVTEYRGIKFDVIDGSVVLKYDDYVLLNQLLILLAGKIQILDSTMMDTIDYYERCINPTALDKSAWSSARAIQAG